MKHRIAMWASTGFLIAGCWGIYFASANKADPIKPIVYSFASLTQPVVAVIALHFNFPVGLRWCLVANAATYALFGLLVETIRKQLNHAN